MASTKLRVIAGWEGPKVQDPYAEMARNQTVGPHMLQCIHPEVQLGTAKQHSMGVAQHKIAQHCMTLHIPAYCRAQHLPTAAQKVSL